MYLTYQPIKRIGQLQLKASHFEALLRLKLMGVKVPPSTFLNTISGSNLAQKRLDYWVLSQVASKIDRTSGLTFSVNLCSASIDRNLPKTLEKTLGERVDRICLEITEKGYLNLEARQTIYSLRDKVTIVVDDLGEGYSCLGLLADLEPRGFKIGRRLVKGLLRSPLKQAIIIKLMEVALLRDLSVVIEFIESPELAEWFVNEWVNMPDLNLWLQGYAIK